jgi:hypothetical protein
MVYIAILGLTLLTPVSAVADSSPEQPAWQQLITDSALAADPLATDPLACNPTRDDQDDRD